MTLRLPCVAFIVCLAASIAPMGALAGHAAPEAASYQIGVPTAAAPAAAVPAAPAPAADRIEGFGTDIPLSLALGQIVPRGLAVTISDDVRKDMKVSWHGSGDWRSVLRQLAKANHLTVNFVGQSVLIGAQTATRQAPSPAAPSVAAGPVDLHPAQPAARAPGLRPFATAPATPVSTAPSGANGVWHAAQGETLDQVLSDWAEISGWTVVFNSQMIYDMQASADFHGDFLQAASALVQSIQAKPQPLATFYRGNRALVISNSIDQVN
jgi:hypothetical protein